jgi:hypothetical protein
MRVSYIGCLPETYWCVSVASYPVTGINEAFLKELWAYSESSAHEFHGEGREIFNKDQPVSNISQDSVK